MKRLFGLIIALCLVCVVACAPAHEHVYETWTTVTAATCTEEGTESSECTVCGKKETRTVPALGHDWQISSISKTATCTEAGVGDYLCSRCFETKTDEIPALGHLFEDADHPIQLVRLVKSVSCTEDGLQIVKCYNCSEEVEDVLPALGHSWAWETVTRAATCTEAGEGTRCCRRKNCGEREEHAEIPMTGHEWADVYTVDKEPTFSEAGSRSVHCLHCSAKKDETVLDMLEAGKPIEYTFRVTRTNGERVPLANIQATIYDGAEEVGNFTFRNGGATAALEPKTYTVKFTGMPEGYSAVQSEYTVRPGNPVCTMELRGSLLTSSAASGTKYTLGSVMHDFTLTTVKGETVTLSALLAEKEIVVLNFWYVGCGFCLYEFPGMEAAYQRFSDDVAIIAVNGHDTDTAQNVKDYADGKSVNSTPLSFHFAKDSADLEEMFGVTAYPTTVVIDKEGVVSYTHDGALIDPNNPNDNEYAENRFAELFEKYGASERTA